MAESKDEQKSLLMKVKEESERANLKLNIKKKIPKTKIIGHICYSVARSFLTLCNPMYYNTPGFPVLHRLPELAQTHVHWVGDAIQPSHPVIPFSSCLQSFPASGFFPMSQLFLMGGQSIGVSASVSILSMNIQDWFPLGLNGLILWPKGLSRVLPVQCRVNTEEARLTRPMILF